MSIKNNKKAHKIGVLSGVITNPSLVAIEGVKFGQLIRGIVQPVPDVESVLAEVTPDAVYSRRIDHISKRTDKYGSGTKSPLTTCLTRILPTPRAIFIQNERLTLDFKSYETEMFGMIFIFLFIF